MAARDQGPEDAPPPPYSETDIYSNAGSRSPPASQAGFRRADSTGQPESVDSSTNGDIIYTPPQTPLISDGFRPQQQAGNNSSSRSTTTHPIADSLSTVSASAYFDTRPAPRLPPNTERITHSLAVHGASAPHDFPCPERLAQRGVTLEDWQTFLNYLLPHHTAVRNDHVIDRKLQAESANGGKGNHEAEAHLRRVQSRQQLPQTADQAHEAAATVQAWNDGFFEPRGVTIRLVPATEDLHAPGEWNEAFDSTDAPGYAGGPHTRDAGPSPNPNSRNYRFAGVTVGDDLLAIGNTFVADRNGLRIGGLMLDDQGIRLHGRNLVPRGGSHGEGFAPPRAAATWGNSRSDIRDHNEKTEKDSHDRQDPESARGRGFALSKGPRGPRDQSQSSSCSSDSDCSESSVGSLPDYDDLKDTQLFPAREMLQRWLAHPDEPITRQSVRDFRDRVRDARRVQPGFAVESLSKPERAAARAEVKALMRQWKDLKRSQKHRRRQERRERRTQRKLGRKEDKLRNKELRRAQNAEHKEQRRARRDDHHNPYGSHPRLPGFWPGQAPYAPYGSHGPHGPVGNIPGVPGCPPAPPAPSMPYGVPTPPGVPPPPAGPQRGFTGFGGFGGRGDGRRGFGHDGPFGGFGGRGEGRRGFGHDGPFGGRGPFGEGGPFGGGGPFGNRGDGPFGERRGLIGGLISSGIDAWTRRGNNGQTPGHVTTDQPSLYGQQHGVTRSGSSGGDANNTNDVHAGSAAKYRELAEIEKEVSKAETELANMWAALDKMGTGKQQQASGSSSSTTPGDNGGDKSTVDEKARAQRRETDQYAIEIEELRKNMRTLRLEADELFAQELEEAERRAM